MSIYHRNLTSNAVKGRKCPSCGRGMALKWATASPIVRFCRWADEGKCDLTLEVARARRDDEGSKA